MHTQWNPFKISCCHHLRSHVDTIYHVFQVLIFCRTLRPKWLFVGQSFKVVRLNPSSAWSGKINDTAKNQISSQGFIINLGFIASSCFILASLDIARCDANNVHGNIDGGGVQYVGVGGKGESNFVHFKVKTGQSMGMVGPQNNK